MTYRAFLIATSAVVVVALLFVAFVLFALPKQPMTRIERELDQNYKLKQVCIRSGGEIHYTPPADPFDWDCHRATKPTI